MRVKKMKDAYLKSNGIDAEDVKKEWGYTSSADIFDGETITFRNKKGELLEDTGMTRDEFFASYSIGKKIKSGGGHKGGREYE